MAGCGCGHSDPFGSSPLYSEWCTQPDPFQLPRFVDGRLADFGRSTHWLMQAIWAGTHLMHGTSAATATHQRHPQPHHETHRRHHHHLRHHRRHHHNRHHHNQHTRRRGEQGLAAADAGDSDGHAPSKALVRAFLQSPTWGSLAIAGSLPDAAVPASPAQAFHTAAHAHLCTPFGQTTLHVDKDPQDLRISLVRPVYSSRQCTWAGVLQGCMDTNSITSHSSQPAPEVSAAIAVDCKQRGRGFVHLTRTHDNRATLWARGIVYVGAIQAGMDVHCDEQAEVCDMNARVVYSGARRHAITGQPESYQVALSSYHFGTVVELSLFHHTAVRVNALPLCYWKNTSYGLLLTYDTSLLRPFQVQVASSWQLDSTTLVQGAVSDRGCFDISIKTRPYHFNSTALNVLPEMTVDVTLSCDVVASRLAFSASLCFGSARQWRKQHSPLLDL
ncbi:hypothetical protein PTSG_09893 [Salpingoeca rosetta]|uniref:Uncharacterized protein n=1 Tax=Salpingoeca rosetta (strain ATCC 50818 / BSB-021) TaxID=946362 RepID=F2UNF7_SALR5|nr:uncharacterized protein PTSG_09893 [Salpingoeca rosetta]EGD79162.1 hypothetical protein PTSG_09893 [Salpingoeca rosetta]|eukprot:XP_004989247.1 hypothetical protein PTSG_09893 [Salpingoeca rosetta]